MTTCQLSFPCWTGKLPLKLDFGFVCMGITGPSTSNRLYIDYVFSPSLQMDLMGVIFRQLIIETSECQLLHSPS